MKTAILIALLATLTGCDARAEDVHSDALVIHAVTAGTNILISISNNYWTGTSSSNVTESVFVPDEEVRAMVKSGRVCEVVGHIWESGCGMTGCLVIHYGEQRSCRLCGLAQSKTTGEWE